MLTAWSLPVRTHGAHCHVAIPSPHTSRETTLRPLTSTLATPICSRTLSRCLARSQVRAALGVSRELVLLYWSIGREILVRQENDFLTLAHPFKERELERGLLIPAMPKREPRGSGEGK